jgi:hypothetical protein
MLRKWRGRTKEAKGELWLQEGPLAWKVTESAEGGSAKDGSFASFSLPCWIEISLDIPRVPTRSGLACMMVQCSCISVYCRSKKIWSTKCRYWFYTLISKYFRVASFIKKKQHGIVSAALETCMGFPCSHAYTLHPRLRLCSALRIMIHERPYTLSAMVPNADPCKSVIAPTLSFQQA